MPIPLLYTLVSHVEETNHAALASAEIVIEFLLMILGLLHMIRCVASYIAIQQNWFV